ncbi:RNA-binding protein [bacterium]|nr:RNA-binding protein [bacterium]
MDIYVGGLSKKITKEELQVQFEKFGVVSRVKLKGDLFSGESKGYAFVIMPIRTEALKAIDKLNGKKIKGQEIKVKEARSHDRDWNERERKRSGKPF